MMHGKANIKGSLYVAINVQKSLAQLGFDHMGLKVTAYMRRCLPDAEIFKYTRTNAAVARSTAVEVGSISYLGSVYMFSI